MTGEIARCVIAAFQQPPQTRIGSVVLTRRETDVLELLCYGMSNRQIAERLGVRYDTACVHLRRAYKKLRVHSRSAAILKYLEAQTAPPASPHLNFAHLYRVGAPGDPH